jgi:hypothetical protein
MGSIGEELYQEVSHMVLAMWEHEPYEIAEEVVSRFDVSMDYALELVERAIVEEIQTEKAMYEEDEWLRDWDGDALASAGFGTDEDYF